MSYASFIAERLRKSSRGRGFTSFITGTAIIGVALGTAALIIALAVLGGFEREITEKVIGFTSHVQVIGFHNQPLGDYAKNVLRIENESPLITAVQPYIAREALIRSKESVDGILLKGVDPARDISAVRKYIVLGSYNIEHVVGALPNIVIGRKLANRLVLTVGDKVAVFATGTSTDLSRMRVMQFRVAGIYESGMADYDDVYAFTSLKDAQLLFQYRNTISGYDILLSQVDSAEVVADQLQSRLRYPHYARTVFDNYRNLFSWIELQKKPVPIILGLIIIVATVNIIGTLLMVVIGKTREIGILRSLGASRRGIAGVFVRQGIWIGIVGTLVGNLFAFTLCYAEQQLHFLSLPSDIYFMTSVPILLRPEYFMIVSGISIALCYLCSLLPALLASRIDPIRAIRFA
ncbi:MAG: ABC transporter permease [Ignavibacteriae bacterium]|nr:ABC transporter permease [Ignavibacteriota bacterium]